MHSSKRYLVQALNTISIVVNRRSNDNSRLATERLVWGFGQEVYGEIMNTSMFFSVTSRRLDESILKRSDGLGTVTIIRAFYFRWRRGSSFRSLYWCTALPLSRPLLKTSLQPLQRLELLLLPEAWCGSCGELINSFAWSVFILWIWFDCFIDLVGRLWRNACLEIELLDWYFNHFRCLFKFACSNARFVC